MISKDSFLNTDRTVKWSFKHCIIACGAHSKNSFCFTYPDQALISSIGGSLEEPEILEKYEATIRQAIKDFKKKLKFLAYDLHPEYLSTKYAQRLLQDYPYLKGKAVQHHHAHIVSCMGENGIKDRVIGVAFDGTGMGSDDNIWGGEFLIAGLADFQRAAHFEYFPLPGGAQAILQPWRTACGLLYKYLGKDMLNLDIEFFRRIDESRLKALEQMINRKINSPLTSSAGRIFDAVAALIGIRDEVRYEGQAAMELERIANKSSYVRQQDYPFKCQTDKSKVSISLEETISAIIKDLTNSTAKGIISAKFHNTLAKAILQTCQILREKLKINRIVLSGGVFQNKLLFSLAKELLLNDKFELVLHKKLQCNDNNISFGQAVIADATSRIKKCA